MKMKNVKMFLWLVKGYYITSVSNKIIFCDENRCCQEILDPKSGYYYYYYKNSGLSCVNNKCQQTSIKDGLYINSADDSLIYCDKNLCTIYDNLNDDVYIKASNDTALIYGVDSKCKNYTPNSDIKYFISASDADKIITDIL